MKIAVFGAGYVGLVTAACFADCGHNIICVDVDAEKVAELNSGVSPIYEPGLDDLLEKNARNENLCFTTDAQSAITHSDIIFIAVGTPSDEDGSADLQYVLAVAKTIASHMNGPKIIVDKSTVPVGTADKVRETIQQGLHDREAQFSFSVVSNPEFLKEGAAINDFMQPDRVIIGAHDAETQRVMQSLYAPFVDHPDKIICMDVRSAELTKYASNAMLATKISFMNEMSQIAERVGADIEKIRLGMGADRRIGYHFINPGCGYGGSCFPKDVTALKYTAQQHDLPAKILSAVEDVNAVQKQRLFAKIQHHFKGDLHQKTFALWGLAFKPNTDDMREAPSRVLLEALWQHGAKVQAYDPVAMQEAARIYGEHEQMIYCETRQRALVGADALIIVTEWNEFKNPDFQLLAQELSNPVIFDGRNLFDPVQLTADGFTYYGIGRGRTEFNDRI